MKAISQETPLAKIKYLILALNLLFIAFCASDAEAQGIRKITNKVPKHLPIKIEITNDDKDNVLREAEVEVTNIGDKPIYHLYFVLNTVDAKSPLGTPITFVLEFGRRELISFEEFAKEGDEAILPQKTYSFKVPLAQVRNFEKKEGEWKNVPNPKKFNLIFQLLNFGNGTGFIGSDGAIYPKNQSIGLTEKFENKSSLFSLILTSPKIFQHSDSPLDKPINFSNQKKSCSADKSNSFFNPLIEFSNSLGCPFGCDDNPSCRPMIYSPVRQGCCPRDENNNPDPFETVPDFYIGSCSSGYPCRDVLWTTVTCNFGNSCWYPTLVGCGTEICTVSGDEVCTGGIDEDCDDKIDCDDEDCGSSDDCVDVCDKDRDGAIAISCGGDDCADDPSNPNAAQINPSAAEDCSDNTDNNCNDKIDCEEGSCNRSEACLAQCDQDGDGHPSLECEGDDCVDDPSNPSAHLINPGEAEACADNIDNDCNNQIDCADGACANDNACPITPEICNNGYDDDMDGFTDCADLNSCSTDPYCSGGGYNYNYYYQQCYEYYQVTTYYYCHSEGCVYLGERWEYLGVSCNLTY